ncbi:MAG TPA: hypothetical protein VGN32_08645 [Ktedonobacterales bacterium]|nr:hypothetical protein [Ktedonobacterales bacterium]
MMWNKRVEGKASPLRVLYVTSAPDTPYMQGWLRALATTLADAGHALLAACPDGSLSGDALAEDMTGQPAYVYATIGRWDDVGGWLHWMTLVRRYRPDSVHLAPDLDLGTATRLALATRLMRPVTLAAEARQAAVQPRAPQRESGPQGQWVDSHRPLTCGAARPDGLSAQAHAREGAHSWKRRTHALCAWLFYRVLVTQILCADVQTARELIRTYRVAPARISLLYSGGAEAPHRSPGRSAAAAHTGQRAWRAPITAPQRARRLVALFEVLRTRDLPQPQPQPQLQPITAPERAIRPATSPHPRIASPRLAAVAGQEIEAAAPAGRALVLGGSRATLAMMIRRTDAR